VVSRLCRRALIDACKGMIYTPENEHFGIVPLEAMARGCPVVACNSGGPLETILHTETGFLSEPTAQGFANAMVLLLTRKADAAEGMRAAARKWVGIKFSRPVFAQSWRKVLAGEALTDAGKQQ
jgi:alpha-1,3/alpha-1,6-mannosyltransferase